MRGHFYIDDVLRVLREYPEGVGLYQIHARLSATMPGTWEYQRDHAKIIKALGTLKRQGYASHLDKLVWAPVVVA